MRTNRSSAGLAVIWVMGGMTNLAFFIYHVYQPTINPSSLIWDTLFVAGAFVMATIRFNEIKN